MYSAPDPMMSEKRGLNGAKDLGNTKNILFKVPHNEVTIVAKKPTAMFSRAKFFGPMLK